jgi:hypothetical protein
VVRLIEEIRDEDFKKVKLNVRVWKYLVSYTEYQFGNRVPGKDYRERKTGERIDNWTVEISTLILVYSRLSRVA